MGRAYLRGPRWRTKRCARGVLTAPRAGSCRRKGSCRRSPPTESTHRRSGRRYQQRQYAVATATPPAPGVILSALAPDGRASWMWLRTTRHGTRGYEPGTDHKLPTLLSSRSPVGVPISSVDEVRRRPGRRPHRSECRLVGRPKTLPSSPMGLTIHRSVGGRSSHLCLLV